MFDNWIVSTKFVIGLLHNLLANFQATHNRSLYVVDLLNGCVVLNGSLPQKLRVKREEGSYIVQNIGHVVALLHPSFGFQKGTEMSP